MAGSAEPDLANGMLAAAERVGTVGELARLLRRLRRRDARQHNRPELTVRELARRSGFAYGVISEYLNGKRLPPTDRFDVLIRLLGASAAEQGALATARDRVEESRRAREPARLVPRELPPDVYGFTGRTAQLDRLDRLLDGADEAPSVGLITAVAGTAGVGKTALAVRWAHRVRNRFPDGCLYVDLRGYDPDRPVPPAEALAGFLRSLGVGPADIPPDEAGRAARYRTLLADRRSLVVLDNARDTDQVRPLLPGEPGCIALITSRDALTGLVVRHGAHRIDLDPLPDADAVDLLGLLIGRRVEAEPDAAAALAALCDRLPLTLRLAAELAGARPDASLAGLVAELTDTQHRLDRLDAGGERRTATRAVFSWSYQNLPDDAARAFRLIGLHPGRHLDAYTMAGLAGTDLARAESLLLILNQAHLIQRTGRGRFGVHDLLRAYAVELTATDSEAEREAALTRLLDQQIAASAAAMELIAPFDLRRPRVVGRGFPVPPLGNEAAALAWLDAERANLVAIAIYAAEHGSPNRASLLARILVRYLDSGAHYQDAELLYTRTLPHAGMTDQAHLLTNLATVWWRLGRIPEAVELHERALRIAREVGDQAEVGRVLIGLGIVYWHQGRVADTLDVGRQAVELFDSMGDRDGQARVLGNLGIVYERLGRYAESIEHHERVLSMFEVPDPTVEANSRSGLGAVLVRLGRYAEAGPHLAAALALAGRIGYRESEAEALDNLGVLYRRQRRYAEALDHHQQALELLHEIGGRSAEGYVVGHLGAVHADLGHYAKAADHHRQALTIAGEVGDDQLAAELLNGLGDTLRSDAAPAEALDHHRRALAISQRIGNRYQQARAHHGIARALADIGDTEGAGSHWSHALALYTELGVPEADEVHAELGG